MAVQHLMLFLLVIICSVVVIANQCGKHAGNKKVSDEIERQKEAMKKQQEKVNQLIDRIAAEIERDLRMNSCPADKRVLARWTNNFYYIGIVSSIGGGDIHVLFDGGLSITHKVQDVSAVVEIKKRGISHVRIGQHVLAKPNGGQKYYIGYVTADEPNNRYTVTFDNNDEASYFAKELTEFPDHRSANEEGARVFARSNDGKYYRGFVTSVSSTDVRITYDNGDNITLSKSDTRAVILDKLPCYSDVLDGQCVIGFWPGRTRYYPGFVVSKVATGSRECYQKQVYNVLFDDSDYRTEHFYQIRLVPCN